VACSVPVNLINYSYLCHKLLKICIIKLKTKIPKLIFSNRQYWTDSAPSEKRKWISPPDGGIIPPIDVQQDGFGLWCQEEGHQGKVDNTTMEDICNPCNDNTGASMKSIFQIWSCPPLEFIKCSANAFLVVCTTRSSGGEFILKDFFNTLHDSINENSQ
jgi:hypothetical protein